MTHIRQALGAKAADFVYAGFAEDVDSDPSEVEKRIPTLLADCGFAFRKHHDEDLHDLLYHLGHAVLRTILDDTDAWADASVSVHREVLSDDLYLIVHWVAPTATGLSFGLLQEFLDLQRGDRDELDAWIHGAADRVRANARLATTAARAIGLDVPAAILSACL
jgi:hypothetical protein